MPRRREGLVDRLPPSGLVSVVPLELRVPDRSVRDKPDMEAVFKGGNCACWRMEGSSNPRSAELPPPERIVSEDLHKYRVISTAPFLGFYLIASF